MVISLIARLKHTSLNESLDPLADFCGPRVLENSLGVVTCWSSLLLIAMEAVAAWQLPSNVSYCRGNLREANDLPATHSHVRYKIRKTSARYWLGFLEVDVGETSVLACLYSSFVCLVCFNYKPIHLFSWQPQEAVHSEHDGKEETLSSSGGDLTEKTNGNYPQTNAETNCTAADAAEGEHAAETNKTSTSFATAETIGKVGCSSHHCSQHEPSDTSSAIPGVSRRKEPDLESAVTVSETAVATDSGKQAGLLLEGQAKAEGDEAAAPAGSAQGNQRSPDSRPASPLLQEVNTQDGSVQIIRDHVTHCPVVFQNSVLYELD